MASTLPPVPLKDLDDLPFTLQIWLNQIRQIVASGSSSIPWSSLNFTGSNITDIVGRAHNNLQSIQGGVSGQYFHLSNDWSNIASTSTNASLTSANGYLLASAASGAINISLPAATNKYRFHVKKTDATANAVNINRAGSDTFEDGTTSKAITVQNKSYTIYADGTSKWYIEATT